jgi:hypothetical protein
LEVVEAYAPELFDVVVLFFVVLAVLLPPELLLELVLPELLPPELPLSEPTVIFWFSSSSSLSR